MPEAKLYLFGSPHFEVGGQPIKLELRKSLALLTYLAIQREAIQRDFIINLLWPDEDTSRGRSLLRHTLSPLRMALPDGWLVSDRETIRCQPDIALWVDVLEFRRLAASCGLHGHPESEVCPACQPLLTQAVGLYQGDFMAGYTLPDSPNFDEWQYFQAEGLRQALDKSLKKLVQCLILADQLDQAIPPARRRLVLDPLNEDATCDLIRLYAWTHQRNLALRLYHECQAALRDQLGIEPHKTTLDLMQAIESGHAPSRPTHPAWQSALAPNLPGSTKEALGSLVSPVAPSPKNNLPAQLTSFIGRKKEIAEINALVRNHRLVTLTGSGGTGKTRLALRVAEELLDAFPDGIYLVELASLADPGLVPHEVVSSLGLIEKPGKSLNQLLEDFLQPKCLLLILDNCEHLLKACAELAAGLVRGAPRLAILATTREILSVGGEYAYRVPPLAMPNPRRLPALEELVNFDAVRLFGERARVVSPGFVITEDNAAEMAQITQRLDGIPLAIELAAARLRLLTVRQIALRINNVFGLLTGGSRTALPRHQTLKAMIDWSYNLLSEKERLLLLRLSIFAGGWSLEAAEVVCCYDGLESDQILNLLGQLVDKSLAQTISSTNGLSRYRMLETVRQYAYDRLVESGGDEVVRDRHLDYFLALSVEAEPYLVGRDQVAWLDRVHAELDNLRQALDWSITMRVVEGMTLVTALFTFWRIRIGTSEGIEWCEKLLEAEAALPDSRATEADQSFTRNLARARTLHFSATGSIGFYQMSSKRDFDRLQESARIFRRLGPGVGRDLSSTLLSLSHLQTDLVQATATAQEGLDLARQMEDAHLIAENLFGAAFLSYHKGDLRQMRDHMAECLGINRELKDQHGAGSCLFNLGYLACLDGDYQKAKTYLLEGVDFFRSVNDDVFLAVTFLNISFVERAKGDFLSAARWGEEALTLARNYDYKDFIVTFLCNLGMIAWADGKYDLAERRGKEALALAQEQGFGTSVSYHLLGRGALSSGNLTRASEYLIQMLIGNTPVVWSGLGFNNPPETTYMLESLAVIAAAQGEMKHAAILLGAIQEWEAQISGIYCPKEHSEHQAALDLARQALGEQGFDAAWKEGQAMTLDQARAYALEEIQR